MSELTAIIISFLKIGVLNFGGGYSMISLLQSEVLSNNWLSLPEFTDIVAISQITPGPIAVNLATYVGYTQLKTVGAIAATAAVSLPSFIIVTIVVKFINKFKQSLYIKNIFFVLKPVIVGMIISATLVIAKTEFIPEVSQISFKSIFVFLAALIAMMKFKVEPVLCIIAAAGLGVVLF